MSDAKPEAKSGPDAFGMLVYALYVGVGGLLVFMFAWSLRGAVDTQNASVCRALTPEFRSRAAVTVTQGGNPVAGVAINPDAQGAAPKTDAQGAATVMLPHGAQEVVLVPPGGEPLRFALDLPGSEDLEIAFDLDVGGSTIGSRSPFMAPEIEAQDLQGNPVKLSDFRGKLVLVNFWATWCEPCITEWPQLDQLAARLGDRDDVVVLAVSIDEKREDIVPFLERMSLDQTGVTVLWDPTSEQHRNYGSDKIPDTFFIDEQGVVSAAFVNVRKWGNPEAFHCVDGSIGRG
ncbi:MAG: TlpA disulfide reductase family protein [Myxococcota bacterium]